jgi:hypothetical protein
MDFNVKLYMASNDKLIYMRECNDLFINLPHEHIGKGQGGLDEHFRKEVDKDRELMWEFVKRKTIIGNTCILNYVCHHFDFEFVRKAIKLYDDNCWFTGEWEYGYFNRWTTPFFFSQLFVNNCVDDEVDMTDEFIEYCVDICNRYHLDLKEILFRSMYDVIEYSFIGYMNYLNVLIDLNIERGFNIDDHPYDNKFILHQLKNYHPMERNTKDQDKLFDIFRKAIDNGAHVYYRKETIIHEVVRVFSKWEHIKWFCDLYIENDYKLEVDGSHHVLRKLSVLNEESFDYIMKYYDDNDMDMYERDICEDKYNGKFIFTDFMLHCASPTLIKHALNKGIEFNDTLIEAIPMNKYVMRRGGLYDRSSSLVTSNFLSVYRFGMELKDIDHIDTSTDYKSPVDRHVLDHLNKIGIPEEYFKTKNEMDGYDVYTFPATKVNKISDGITHYECIKLIDHYEDPDNSDPPIIYNLNNDDEWDLITADKRMYYED